jgi:hypothetical protein
MLVAESNAWALYHHLKAHPNQLNTSDSLARQLGITPSQVGAALRWVRSNCTGLGWTIPWVERGRDRKHYHVVEAFGVSEIRDLLDGTNDEAVHFRSAMQRRRLQAELCADQCRTPGSRGHRRALALMLHCDAADHELGMVETT